MTRFGGSCAESSGLLKGNTLNSARFPLGTMPISALMVVEFDMPSLALLIPFAALASSLRDASDMLKAAFLASQPQHSKGFSMIYKRSTTAL